MTTRATQNALILRLLREYGTVSARDLLLHHGIARTAARIFDLKAEGHVIETIHGGRMADGRTAMASYRLVTPEKPRQVSMFSDEVRA